VVRLLAVFLLFSTGCVESYRTVAPIAQRPALAFDETGIVVIESDGGDGRTYGFLLRYPTFTTDSIVGTDVLDGKRRAGPLAPISRLVTREQYVLDKFASLHPGSVAVPIPSHFTTCVGCMEIRVRK
jgi:hypothetical protein